MQAIGTEPNLLSKMAFDLARYRKEIEGFKARLRTFVSTISVTKEEADQTDRFMYRSKEKLARDLVELPVIVPKIVRETSTYKKYAHEITILLPKS